MTERLYYGDADLLEFEATVRHVEPADGGFHVYLDRTAFYPESGGQNADTGTLNGVPVLDVQEDDNGDIFHRVAAEVAGPSVHGVVDAAHRFDHMQQHTGQHLLSAAFVELWDLPTVGFHMSDEFSTVDIGAEKLDEARLRSAVTRTNQVIWENRPVRTGFHSREAVESLGLRKPTQRTGDIRVVEVEGCDRSACGGTHVASTGRIGILVVTRTEKMKDKTRLYFLCGGRVLRSFEENLGILTRLSALTTSGFPELPDRVDKLLQTAKGLERECQKLKADLLETQIPFMIQQHRLPGGAAVVVLALDETAGAIRTLCQKLIAGENQVLAAVASRPDGTLFLGRSPDRTEDVTQLVVKLRSECGLKGGGRPDFAQLGGIPSERLDAVLAACRDWFSSFG